MLIKKIKKKQREKGKGLKEMANFTSFKDFKIHSWAGCYKHQPALILLFD